MKAYSMLVVAGLVGVLCGCSTPVKIGGARIGDGRVDKTEKGWLNTLRPGTGDQVQSMLGSPDGEDPESIAAAAILAAGFKRDASMVITLKTNAVLTGRTFSDADIESITVAPRWIAPTIQPIAVTPAQIMGGVAAPGAGGSDAGNVEATEPGAGPVSIMGIMEQIGGAR